MNDARGCVFESFDKSASNTHSTSFSILSFLAVPICLVGKHSEVFVPVEIIILTLRWIWILKIIDNFFVSKYFCKNSTISCEMKTRKILHDKRIRRVQL